jgi:hypothetical protein
MYATCEHQIIEASRYERVDMGSNLVEFTSYEVAMYKEDSLKKGM